MRLGLTLIELIIVALIISISAAVVVPNWVRYQESVRLSSAAMSLAADFRALQRHASRASQPLSVEFGSTYLNIVPAAPNFIGDANGKIDYAMRYPGVQISRPSFLGSNVLNIDMRGDLYFVSEPTRVTRVEITLSLGSQETTVELQATESGGPPESSNTDPADTGTLDPATEDSGSGPSITSVSESASSSTQ